VVLFLGLFFTLSPKKYVDGSLKQILTIAKPKVKELVNVMSSSLSKCLKGKLFAMLIEYVLTANELLVICMSMAFALTLIAGNLNFIPNFGPLIAMVPIVMLALLQGI
jgi:predicted PurR-regulated permease PerM